MRRRHRVAAPAKDHAPSVTIGETMSTWRGGTRARRMRRKGRAAASIVSQASARSSSARFLLRARRTYQPQAAPRARRSICVRLRSTTVGSAASSACTSTVLCSTVSPIG